MSTRAYLVGFLEKSTGKFLGASIFGESSPTTSLKLFPFVMLEVSCESYSLAESRLLSALSLAPYKWIEPFMRVKGAVTELA